MEREKSLRGLGLAWHDREAKRLEVLEQRQEKRIELEKLLSGPRAPDAFEIIEEFLESQTDVLCHRRTGEDRKERVIRGLLDYHFPLVK